jgi:hypothetical protein
MCNVGDIICARNQVYMGAFWRQGWHQFQPPNRDLHLSDQNAFQDVLRATMSSLITDTGQGSG